MVSGILAIFQFVFVTLLAAFAAGILVTVVAHFQSIYLRYMAKEQQLRDRIVLYSRLVTGLQERVESRKSAAAGAASILFGSQRLEKQLKMRLRELEKEPHRFVRIVGVEQLPNQPFEIMAVNSSVAHQVKRGERHAFYDSSWARPAPVHVWAKSLEEAKTEFERVFPRATGFKILSLHKLSSNGAGVAGNEAGAIVEPELSASPPDYAPEPAPTAPRPGQAKVSVNRLVPPRSRRPAAQPAEVPA